MIRTLSRKAAFAFPLTALALAASCAHAASVGSSGNDFYNLPSTLPASHGELLSYRVATVKLGTGAPASKAWNVMYTTLDSDGNTQASTGTVFVPSSGSNGQVILYAVGTQGLGNDCAASKQFASGAEYEIANINAALKAGYSVLVTDYVGYTNGGVPHYMGGESQGRAVLDIFKAAQGIPSVGISSSAKVGIWGFSQGGQSAAFAAELAPTYTPEISVVGVAHGGTPSDFNETAHYLNGRNGSAFMFSTMIGLNQEYGSNVPLDLALSDAGTAAFEKLKTECIFTSLFEYMNQDISMYTSPGWTIDKLLSLKSVVPVIQAQTLGTKKLPFPIYQYHGQADEFIPLSQAYALKKRYCSNGNTVAFDLYPSEHIATQFQGAPYALAWLGDRFSGKPADNTCSTSQPDPVSTAQDNSGHLKVALSKWPLTGKVHLRTLMQDVVLPTSTFDAMTDMNDKTMSGNMAIPDFVAPVKIIGIPFSTGMKIEPTGPVNGNVSLDTTGTLHVKGDAQVNLIVTSLIGIPLGQCKTVTPVDFPLNFDGPISSLGNGSLTFTGTTTFPQVKGCFLSAILSAFMSGSGQTYTFTVAPPAPVRN